MRWKDSQGQLILVRMGVDFKGDLVFKDLFFNQGKRGRITAVGFNCVVRGHEMSDQDTKQTLGAV